MVLAVLEVSIGVPGADHSLTGHVELVRSALGTDHPEATAAFESRLQETGYSDDDDYSDWAWGIQRAAYFNVSGDFPRLQPWILPVGISKVTYSLALSSITSFEIEPVDCLDLLRVSHVE